MRFFLVLLLFTISTSTFSMSYKGKIEGTNKKCSIDFVFDQTTYKIKLSKSPFNYISKQKRYFQTKASIFNLLRQRVTSYGVINNGAPYLFYKNDTLLTFEFDNEKNLASYILSEGRVYSEETMKELYRCILI